MHIEKSTSSGSVASLHSSIHFLDSPILLEGNLSSQQKLQNLMAHTSNIFSYPGNFSLQCCFLASGLLILIQS